ncbi:hypothetical protein [Actinomadura rugatobispora]|uniref:DUF308 domain-containing protein n=1 Tax=Actinomadura rugatobispora TaxID=1994 RepID=A0ABW1AIP8_9ACTN|nr:hypothetical protein GCM10010200_073210 [Actinomadura rugatobispora]
MNRRGNGLSADTYAPLVDLAPHLADVMLTALRDAGVAAYAASPEELAGLAEEAASAAASGGAAGSVDDVLDRLYVDVEMKPTAESVLRVHLTRLRDPDSSPTAAESTGAGVDSPATATGPDRRGDAAELDEDAIWAEIVAGYDAAPEGDQVPWPDEENIDEPAAEPPREGDDRTGRLPRARVIKAADLAKVPAEEDGDEEGHYVPPPPPPLPSADPLTKGAWIALVGGPLYLLVTVILDWEVPGYAAFLAVAAFIGGFVTLVLRMGDEPRDPDDGAVV